LAGQGSVFVSRSAASRFSLSTASSSSFSAIVFVPDLIARWQSSSWFWMIRLISAAIWALVISARSHAAP
jgi:hypothetical protein